MNTNSDKPKFREGAILAVVRDALGIEVHFKGDGFAPIKLRWAQLSEPVKAEAFGYGMEVRLTRQAALARDEKTGKPVPVSEKYEAVRRLAEHYATGTEAWAMASAGGGGGLSADARALIEALVRVIGLTADVAEEQYREMSSAERDALRVDPEFKAALDAIYAERAKSAGVAGMTAKNLIEKLKARVPAQTPTQEG